MTDLLVKLGHVLVKVIRGLLDSRVSTNLLSSTGERGLGLAESRGVLCGGHLRGGGRGQKMLFAMRQTIKTNLTAPKATRRRRVE